MTTTILFALICLWAISSYSKGDLTKALVGYTILFTSGFIINLGESTVKPTDFSLLFLCVASAIGYLRDNNFFRWKGQFGAKCASLFLLFFVIELLYSLFLSVDTPSYIITVIRANFSFLVFFVFRNITPLQLQKAIKVIFGLTILSCVLYIVQYLTHIELVNSYIAEDSADYRMQGTPPFISLLLLTFFAFGSNLNKRWLVLLILFAVCLIAQNRTPLYAFIMEVAIFLVLSRGGKRKVSVIILMLLVFPFITSLFDRRASEENTSTSDVSVMSFISNDEYVGLSKQNNFLFRIALVAERADYLINHPDKLLLGVGAIHEDSNNNKFMFSVGTGQINASGYYVNQLESVDVMWGPILIRWGLLGVLLHLIIMLRSAFHFYRQREYPVLFIGFLIAVGAIASSFSSANFFGFSGTFLLSMLYIFDTWDEEYKDEFISLVKL